MSQFEEWRDVPGYGGQYRVSSLGRVWSRERTIRQPNGGYQTFPARIMRTPLAGWDKYPSVGLAANGKKRFVAVHRLMAEVFLNIPLDKQVNHLNGIKTDNRLDNFEITDSAGNLKHAWATGLCDKAFGVSNVKAKLNPEAVREIRRRLATGETCASIARFYHVNWSTISDIKSGHRWRHVA